MQTSIHSQDKNIPWIVWRSPARNEIDWKYNKIGFKFDEKLILPQIMKFDVEDKKNGLHTQKSACQINLQHFQMG